jgi:hypothetical protein
MFRSLLYDRPQGSSFVLSAFTTFLMFASSFVFFYVAVCNVMFALENNSTILRSGFGGLWYPSSRVQTRPKPSDF